MSTGDLKNHGTRLQSLLRTTKYPHDINYSSLFYGYPQEYLPLLHYLFQDYTLSFSKYLLKRGYEMSGKSDKQFIDVVYKVLRDEFEYVPRLSKEKFFSNGFTEQKLILTSSAYQYVIDRCRSSRKQKLKTGHNKENVNKTRTVNKDKKCSQMTVEPRALEEQVPPPRPEHSPMRRAPQPNVSQPYNLTEVVEESIIEIPADSQRAPQNKVYSEEGARDIFALDHLSANVVDIVDSTPGYHGDQYTSTPQTVLNRVQLVPQTCEMLPVSVTREHGYHGDQYTEHTVQTREPGYHGDQPGSCTAQCCHAADIAHINNLLVTINARLDILESKANHPGKLNNPAGLNNFRVNSTIYPAPRRPEQNESLQKLVTFAEPVTCDLVNSSTTSVEESEDDIKYFLKSVQEKLNDTRSFLRTYDTSQL